MSTDAGVNPEPQHPVRVVLLTRVGCVACEAAARALDGMGLNDTEHDGTGHDGTGHDDDAAAAGRGWSAVDVDAEAVHGDPELRMEYGDRLPVVLLDGREHSYGEVDEARLRRDLGR